MDFIAWEGHRGTTCTSTNMWDAAGKVADAGATAATGGWTIPVTKGIDTLAYGATLYWAKGVIETWVVDIVHYAQAAAQEARTQTGAAALELLKGSTDFIYKVLKDSAQLAKLTAQLAVKDTSDYALRETHDLRKKLQRTARPLRRIALQAHEVMHTEGFFSDTLQKTVRPLRRIALHVDGALHTDVRQLYRDAVEDPDGFFEAIRGFWNTTQKYEKTSWVSNVSTATKASEEDEKTWWTRAYEAMLPHLSHGGQVMAGKIESIRERLGSTDKLVMMCTLLMLFIGAFATPAKDAPLRWMQGVPLNLAGLGLRLAGQGNASHNKKQALLQLLFATEMFMHLLHKHGLAPVAYVMQQLLGTCGELLPSAVKLSTGVVKDCSGIAVTLLVVLYSLHMVSNAFHSGVAGATSAVASSVTGATNAVASTLKFLFPSSTKEDKKSS